MRANMDAMVEVKICGIREAAALDATVAAGADWIGFNFFRPSPRWVERVEAAALAARVPSRIGIVGLFVTPTDTEVEITLRQVRLDALQIYADTSRVGELAARFGVPVWHAVGVGTPSDLPGEASAAARLVIEAKPPKDATRPGGNAARFDWSVLRGWRAPVPWVLAGGLTPATVGEAVRETGASAVDVSSGVETTPGVKDPRLIAAFIAAARSVPSFPPPSGAG